MNGKSWADAAIREIVDLEGDNWRAWVDAIRREAARRWSKPDRENERIALEEYEAVEIAALGRIERMAGAHERHLEETPAIKRAKDGKTVALSALVAEIVPQSVLEPKAKAPIKVVPAIRQRERLVDLETLRERRSKWPSLAALTRLPHDLRQGLSGATQAALKPILDACYYYGECTYAIGTICERAGVSRTAAYAGISDAIDLGLIKRERSQHGSRQISTIHVTHPGILEWWDRCKQISRLFRIEKIEENERDITADSSPKLRTQAPVETSLAAKNAWDARGRPSAETGCLVAENAETSSAANSGAPKGIADEARPPSKLEQALAEWEAMIAAREAERRSTEEDRDPGG